MLKKLFIIFCILIFNNAIVNATYVRPHITKNGTYVSGHYRSKPNRTKLDNYSTKGNYNPYTGKRGTAKLYKY